MLFGKGNIGSRWLELFAREQEPLSARSDFEFILAGVVDSRRSLLDHQGIDPSRALAFLMMKQQCIVKSRFIYG